MKEKQSNKQVNSETISVAGGGTLVSGEPMTDASCDS